MIQLVMSPLEPPGRWEASGNDYWSGSDMIGGSPRVGASKISPSILEKIINEIEDA